MPEIAGTTRELELPTAVFGFHVEIGVGPYPVGHTRSHRRAIIAKLRPMTAELGEKLRRAGYDRGAILGVVPVDAKTARQLQLPVEHPDRPTVEEQEKLALAALRPAAGIAKMVYDAPT